MRGRTRVRDELFRLLRVVDVAHDLSEQAAPVRKEAACNPRLDFGLAVLEGSSTVHQLWGARRQAHPAATDKRDAEAGRGCGGGRPGELIDDPLRKSNL